MISRRDFLQVSMAASALYGASGFGNWGRLAAQQRLTQDDLLNFDTFGNVTLIHVTDIHAQMKPIYFREPEINLGVGGARGQMPHITGADFRRAYGIADGSPSHYALTYNDFSALAGTYGRVGGLDRVATVINAIRADRPDALLLDGGDTWHGSGEEQKQRCEHHRHELHHPGLHGIRGRGIQRLLEEHRRPHQQGKHEVGVNGRQILNPKEEGRLAKLYGFIQHPVQRQENGHL